MKKEYWATVRWCIDDIKNRREDWDDARCATFLDKIERNLEDRMVERGWDVIDDLLEEEDPGGGENEEEEEEG